MVDKIKLPRPFGKIVHKLYHIRDGQILAAYVDEIEYKAYVKEGVLGLREYLGLTDGDSVCDCYCVVKTADGVLHHLIFEDKNTAREKELILALIQLNKTHKRLMEKKNVALEAAVISNIKLPSLFTSKTYPQHSLKVLERADKPIRVNLSNDGKKVPVFVH